MKVCLVNPSSPFLVDDRTFPPLGLLRVAGVLEKEGHEVVIADTPSAIPACSFYGITATTPQLPAIDKLQFEGRTVIGGPHVTMSMASARRGSERGKRQVNQLLSRFSCIVAGDGEKAILDSFRVDGILDADNLGSPYYVQDQDAVPFPARHLIDMNAYRYEIGGKKATSMVAQLGCPFGCAYCGGRYSPFYRRVRYRSINSVMMEVMHLMDLGYGGIMFLDDELNVSTSMPELMARLAPMGLALRGFVRASTFTERQAEMMAKAGFKEVLFGFESGSDRILTNMHKGNVETNTLALQAVKRTGMRVKALMSVGHPGESKETIMQTLDWLVTMKPDDFDVTMMTPYPGTPYWDDAEKQGNQWVYTAESGDKLYQKDVDYFEEEAFYKGIPGQYRALVHTNKLSEDQLVELRDLVEYDARNYLGAPWPASRHFDHSMGMP